MRSLLVALFILFATGCGLTPDQVSDAKSDMDHAVVFDIDGTLTPDVIKINTVRKGAADAVNDFAVADIKIVYLSARTPIFQSAIPGWLDKNGFPQGSIHVTETREERKDHAAFKRGILEKYLAAGWTLVAAYGDSSTDFEAYADAGIPRERVFALLRNKDEKCQEGIWEGCYEDWASLTESIKQVIDATR